GMGFIFKPERQAEAQDFLQQTMGDLQRELKHALPFAMGPVVYDFAINPYGTVAALHWRDRAMLPPGYYAMTIPLLLRDDPRQLTKLRRAELARFGAACRSEAKLSGMIETVFD